MVLLYEKIFNNVAKKIISILDEDHSCTEIEYIQMLYGIQNILYNVVITGLILFLSYITETFIETLLLFTFFGMLRIIAGGYHCNSIEKCLAATTLIMVGGGKFIQSIQVNLPICIIVCILVNITFFTYIPKGTHNNPYSLEYSIKQHKRFKIISVILTIISIFSNSILRGAIVYSMAIVAILLFPTIKHKPPIPE